MAVHHLPPRPTVANPERQREQIEKSVSEIDKDIDVLFCITAMLASSSYVPEEAIEALQTTHNRLRQQCDSIATMM